LAILKSTTKSAIKLHTLLDLRGNIPSFIVITDGKGSDLSVELFFKWIKQHLRIKAFFGTSRNAVETQIWIAISIYLLIAIIKKTLKLDESFCTLSQILSLSLFERTQNLSDFIKMNCKNEHAEMSYKPILAQGAGFKIYFQGISTFSFFAILIADKSPSS
jgi:hypothetical protein